MSNGSKSIQFEAELVTDAKGKPTTEASELIYNHMQDKNSTLDVSIGAEVIDAEPMYDENNNFKGIDFIRTNLVEISAVAIGANDDACVTKTLGEKLNNTLKNKDTNKELESLIEKHFEKLTKTIQVLEDRLDEISCNMVDKSNAVQQDNQPEKTGLQEKELIELLDKYIQKTKE
jgi:hypothetical protein